MQSARALSHRMLHISRGSSTLPRAPTTAGLLTQTRTLHMTDTSEDTPQSTTTSTTSNSASSSNTSTSQTTSASPQTQTQSNSSTTTTTSPSPQSQTAKMQAHKQTQAELDRELQQKLADLAGDGGEAGVEMEDGHVKGIGRGVKTNMFRYI